MERNDLQWLSEAALAARVLAAAVLSALVGWERETLDKPAGLRTHVLVGTGAALLTTIGAALPTLFGHSEGIEVDPTRIVQAIVAGVAFIGAGTIIRHRQDDEVEGLTTAASLFVTTAIAVACGFALFLLAALVTVAVLLVLRGMNTLIRRIRSGAGRSN